MGWLIGVLLGFGALFVFVGMQSLTVMPGRVALLYRKGRFARELASGHHRWFDPLRLTKTIQYPIVPQTLPTYDVNVISRDQFSFRIGLTPVVEINDPRAYHETRPADADEWPGYPGLAFADLQAPLLAATIECVGALTLEAFLADTGVIAAQVKDRIAATIPGTLVVDVLMTAITMPPEVRKMFTEVERARREGLAALERARSETASLRALANAARSLQSNPQLAQLRVLQAMEAAKGAKTFILGNALVDGAASVDVAPKDGGTPS